VPQAGHDENDSEVASRMGFRQFQGRLGSVSGHAILSECWHAVHCTRQGELPASDLFVGFPIPAAKAVFMTTLRFWCSNVIWTGERWRCVLDQARGSRQGRRYDNNSPQAMWGFSSGVWHLRSVRNSHRACRKNPTCRRRCLRLREGPTQAAGWCRHAFARPRVAAADTPGKSGE